jgi:hypothetical protein
MNDNADFKLEKKDQYSKQLLDVIKEPYLLSDA